jgi:hypothetical protein
MATYNGLYFRASFPISVGIPFTADPRVGGRPGDNIGEALASRNVVAADPATGVARAASDEVPTAIAGLFSVAAFPYGKDRMKIV